MTKKRFKIKDSILNEGYVIIDNEKEYTFPVLDSTLNHMFCKALNELHEDLMNVRAENTRNKLVLNNIVEDLEKHSESKEPIIIGKEYVKWIKGNVDVTLG